MEMPANYREISITLSNEAIVSVAALAKPNYAGQNPKDTFDYLMNQKIGVVFGLEAEPYFQSLALTSGLKYIDCTIPDFTAPPLEMYDQIYDEMLKQAQLGKKIAIHCHGGMGRTGTVLTALKLKEMSMDESFYHVSARQNLDIALSELRKLPGNRYIVEVPEQENRLIEYIEIMLLKKNQTIRPRLY